jgi:hypothetical protein
MAQHPLHRSDPASELTDSFGAAATGWRNTMTRFLLAIVRNCGVAIAISVFFAAARGPAHPASAGAVDAIAAAAARSPELTAQARVQACDRPAERVCRLVESTH